MHGIGDWDDLGPHILKWLRVVKEESDAPDLWALAQQERAWLTSTDVGANTPFTVEERRQITQHLSTIEKYAIKTYKLTGAHQAHVREQLRYLNDAAGRVGRFDWKNLAASTFLNIVLTLGLNPEKVQTLLALATQLLGPLVAAGGSVAWAVNNPA